MGAGLDLSGCDEMSVDGAGKTLPMFVGVGEIRFALAISYSSIRRATFRSCTFVCGSVVCVLIAKEISDLNFKKRSSIFCASSRRRGISISILLYRSINCMIVSFSFWTMRLNRSITDIMCIFGSKSWFRRKSSNFD